MQSSVTLRLNEEIKKVLILPEVKQRYTAMGLDVAGTTPQQFADYMNAELAKFAPIVNKANISIEE